MANRTFDRLVGADASCIDPSQVCAELKELRSKGEKLEEFANAKVAHLVERPAEPPTMPELDLCVRAFEAAVLRYLLLFRATAPSALLPTWQYDWKAIFREPWILTQQSGIDTEG